MIRKKILAVLALIGISVFMFTGCQGNAQTNESTTTVESETDENTPEYLELKEFDDSQTSDDSTVDRDSKVTDDDASEPPALK